MLRRPFQESTRPCRRCGGAVRPRFGLATVVCTACRTATRAERATRRPARENPAYLAWIRSLPCAVRPRCGRPGEHAHHVRIGTGGGIGLKPPDVGATVPLCAVHHAELHAIGARTFEARHAVDLRALAERLAQLSPHLNPAPEPTP